MLHQAMLSHTPFDVENSENPFSQTEIAIISYNSYISLAPSTLLDMEFVSYSFFVLEKTKNVKNNLRG